MAGLLEALGMTPQQLQALLMQQQMQQMQRGSTQSNDALQLLPYQMSPGFDPMSKGNTENERQQMEDMRRKMMEDMQRQERIRFNPQDVGLAYQLLNSR